MSLLLNLHAWSNYYSNYRPEVLLTLLCSQLVRPKRISLQYSKNVKLQCYQYFDFCIYFFILFPPASRILFVNFHKNERMEPKPPNCAKPKTVENCEKAKSNFYRKRRKDLSTEPGEHLAGSVFRQFLLRKYNKPLNPYRSKG